MKEPSNLTPDELLAWAYEVDSGLPMQDFDLLITDLGNLSLFLRLAGDEGCPKRWFFLHCLYLFVGDTVRVESRFPGKKQQELSHLHAIVMQPWSSHWIALQRWAERSRILLDHPGTFVYADWCDSGFVLHDRQA